MMTVLMDSSSSPSSREVAQRLYKKNIELENGLRKSAQLKIPSDPNVWLQMRENYEAMVLEDHDFSEKHEIEYALWQLHYRRIEEFRSRINAASSVGSVKPQGGKSPSRPDSIRKIRSVFKTFLSEATGFYHDFLLKIRAKYGLPLGSLSDGLEGQNILTKDEKKSSEMKKGQMSCHRCLIYLGDLARYKVLYGEGDSTSRDYGAASSYYQQAATLCPSSGNPHHQLAILASYSSDDLGAVYRYFRSLAVDSPFSTARDNLIIAFEKNRQSYAQLPGNANIISARTLPPGPTRSTGNGRGRGRGDTRHQVKDSKTESSLTKDYDINIPEILKAFFTRFVRFNGILFTRTSLESFDEIFSSVISDFCQLLSSGPEEGLNFGQDAAENGLVLVRLITILIFTVHNVKRDADGQSYAEILQRTVLLRNAFTAAFEFAGCILKRCIQLRDTTSSSLLPAISVFVEWLACHQDIAAGTDLEEKRSTARSFFWKQFVSFLNKLLQSGLVSSGSNEDESCFVDMGRYEEGETGNRVALWEDFELRGFLPLLAAHVILDFSRKHSFGSDGSMMEKKARVQRIFAAGRALIDVAQIDQQGIYFDQNLNKFVTGVKPVSYDDHTCTGLPQAHELNGSKGNLVGSIGDKVSLPSTVKLEMTSSKVHLNMEGEEEEEEEEIVFKPMVTEKYPKSTASNASACEIIQPVQSTSISDWATYVAPISAPLRNSQMSPVVNATSQLPTPAPSVPQQSLQHIISDKSKWLMEQEQVLSDRITNLKIAGVGNVSDNYRLQNGFGHLQPTAFSPLVSGPASLSTFGMLPYGEMKVAEPVIPSKLDSVMHSGPTIGGSTMRLSAALPMPSRKNPVSRPTRHLGPPPGFDNVPSKLLDDSNSHSVIKEQNLQSDDYRWLDGYKSTTTNDMGMTSANHGALHVNTSKSSNTSTGVTTFPFPGKQVFAAQTGVVNEKWQDFQLFEHLKPLSDQQRQHANLQASLLPEQYQAHSLWPGRDFV